MRRLPLLLTIALTIVVVPSMVMAEDAKKEKKDGPPRHDPAQFFKKLDANSDGKLTLEELPEAMREHLGKLFAKADKNEDKVVTLEEFVAVAKDRPAGPPDARRGKRGPDDPKARQGERRKPDGPPREGKQGKDDCMKDGPGGPPPAKCDRRPDGPPPGPGMELPDPKKIFERLDANEDKQLSLEEFTDGMKKMREMHEKMMQRLGPPRAWRPDMRHSGMHPDGDRGPGGPDMRPERPWWGPGRDDMSREERIEKMKQRAKELFEKADANKDGKLGKDEAPEPMKEHFDKIDANDDGQLTPEELKEAWNARRKARDEGAGKADKRAEAPDDGPDESPNK